MRLWTFQYKECGDVLLNGDVWRCLPSWHGDRIKEFDKRFIKKVDGKEYRPIYCFCKVMGYTSLSLNTMVHAYNELDRYFKLDLRKGGRLMYELEVPEEFIMQSKLSYISEDGNGEVYENHISFMRRQEDTTESLISEIRPEWVVAIREFAIVHNGNAVSCTTTMCRDELNPAWGGQVLFADGYMYTHDLGKWEHLMYDDSLRRIRMLSMSGVPSYYTVAEALDSCETFTLDIITKQIQRKGVPKSLYGSVTIQQLFDNKL